MAGGEYTLEHGKAHLVTNVLLPVVCVGKWGLWCVLEPATEQREGAKLPRSSAGRSRICCSCFARQVHSIRVSSELVACTV